MLYFEDISNLTYILNRYRTVPKYNLPEVCVHDFFEQVLAATFCKKKESATQAKTSHKITDQQNTILFEIQDIKTENTEKITHKEKVPLITGWRGTSL
jgi:hypothetical protein